MQRKKNLIGLDFETYSSTDIRNGLDRYMGDPFFQPLIASTVHLEGNSIVTHKYFLAGSGPHERAEASRLFETLDKRTICAHNAGFEMRVLQHMGLDLPAEQFVDTAFLARCNGVSGRLEAAAPQLLNLEKLEVGRHLIQLFCVPSKEQVATGRLAFNPDLIVEHASDWSDFSDYCEMDARLSFDIAMTCLFGASSLFMSDNELLNAAITQEMNLKGWHVDVRLVEEMQRRYQFNLERLLEEFWYECDAADLNLNSLPQLKKWCAERGVKMNSFDEKHVASAIDRIDKRLLEHQYGRSLLTDDQVKNYGQVYQLLSTKQSLGGSSLKKLQTILDTVGDDGRLRDQYLHVGAALTWRTTGRSVQMQNLTRLHNPQDVDELLYPGINWSNEKMAQNLRQVFCSAHPKGKLVVGDLSSIESRGLAWLAGAEQKLKAYADGQDLYKVLASQRFGVPYDQVSPEQRMFGKVGELSCGYQAGGSAVQAFAEKMKVKLSDAEANDLVQGWRALNPEIVDLWELLDAALHEVLAGPELNTVDLKLKFGGVLSFSTLSAPKSLTLQDPKADTSLFIRLYQPLSSWGEPVLKRLFHGIFRNGRSVCFYKPSELKNGDLWSPSYVNPKTKQRENYSLYGGKLAGILTQSLCREIFFNQLQHVHRWTSMYSNVDLIGQFHDEIVLDWLPDSEKGGERTMGLEETMHLLKQSLTTPVLPELPLAAEVKSAYRYIK